MAGRLARSRLFLPVHLKWRIFQRASSNARQADAVLPEREEPARTMLEARGLTTRLLSLDGAPPIVVADLKAQGSTRTLAFYAHYDGQPVDATQWKSAPWTPVMRGDREQLIEDILIGKLANMNYFRLTQSPVQPEVYDMCDRLGMMVQTDLPLFGYALPEVVGRATAALQPTGRRARARPGSEPNSAFLRIERPSS